LKGGNKEKHFELAQSFADAILVYERWTDIHG